MSKKIFVLIIIIGLIAFGYFLFDSWSKAEYLSKTKHETICWVIILDSKDDVIAVETVDPNVWSSFVSLYKNKTEIWIGGIVEEYDNYWGFRFKPDSIVIAEITIKGAQSNIQAISQDLNYWISTWGKQTYVLAKVKEINEILF